MAPLFHMCFLLLVGFLLRVYDNFPFRSAVYATLCYKIIVCNRKQNLLTLTTINALNYLSNDLQNHHIIYILQILQIIIQYIPFIFHISYIIIFDYLIQLQFCLSYSLNDILVFFLFKFNFFCFAFTIIDNHSSQLKTRQNFEFVFVVFVF